MENLHLIDHEIRNTIRDGGSTALYTAYTVDTAGTLDTVYNVYYSNCFSLLKQ